MHPVGQVYSLLKVSFLTPGSVLKCAVRCRQFNPTYVPPILDRDKLQRMQETGEITKLAHVPVLPATSTENVSVYCDPVVKKFTNYLMRDGMKLRAQNLVLKCLERVKRYQVKRFHSTLDPEEKAKIEVDPLKIFHSAVDNCKPLMQLQPIKRGGATYQVPRPITANRSSFLAMNWLIEAGRDKDRSVIWPDQMAQELINAANNKGRVVKRKQDLHKQCEANRAYAHYRWG